MSKYQTINQELLEWAKSYTGEKFHAVFCDPPYGLEFMGKEWDKPKKGHIQAFRESELGGFGGYKPHVRFHRADSLAYQMTVKEWGEAILPHLYPGALVFMFGGTRMWHRLAAGMEDAGFEMWDTLMWLYGQGFPKAQDISKLIDKQNGAEREIVGQKVRGDMKNARENQVGYLADPANHNNTKCFGYGVEDITRPSDVSIPWSGHKTCALKPAWEPILCFKAPNQGKTYAQLATEFGSGCLNVDGGRISIGDSDDPRLGGKGDWGTENAAKNVYEGGYAGDRVGSSPLGRYPANLILDEESAVMLDEQSGERTAGSSNGAAVVGIEGNGVTPLRRGTLIPRSDSGGASRFFYCAKAGTKERSAGCDNFSLKNRRTLGCGLTGVSGDRSGNGGKVTPLEMGNNKLKNTHPTIKPLSLNKYLATLLLPPDSVKPRRLLVPFAGSGSEMIGALQAGWDEVIGIERETEYCEIAEARLKHHLGDKD